MYQRKLHILRPQARLSHYRTLAHFESKFAMDEFAQSREDDDLFADEFEAFEEPSVTTSFTPATSHALNDREAPRAAEQAYRESTSDRRSDRQGRGGRGQGQGRGGQERRGRGGNIRGRGGQNGLSASKYADPAPAPATSNPIPQTSPATTTAATPITTIPNTSPEDTAQTTPQPPSIPSEPTNPDHTPTAITNNAAITSTRTPAVRGDRSATGGPAHKKLTEEELTAKMEKMAIINAQKAERHRLSEADQAAFQHREKELAKERKEKAVAEKRNERAMEMERAKNRERKMKAQGGREWDEGKTEADIVDGSGRGRSSEYVRGGHGGVIRGGLAGSRYAEETEGSSETQSARGRGTFEIRGRGGRGRGGRGGKLNSVAPTSEDFPALPSASAVKSPVAKPAGDWADEMATPVEEKKENIL